ncbi:PREDICTED: uncharacterized protein LOC106749139 [Dinoponera quadriceps]|uniref:Uncharacterized protein LOC106749139 n=1 Tax=Dinoponera quadriceps TaxID=609295 RepID=A0A6P3XZ25_DINQU|nr:PREDICTED: uncharacterized protein LOC106749139 [Dinoponera quadriceps]
MAGQRCLTSVASKNDPKNAASNFSILTTYGNKSVKLNIAKDVVIMYENSLLEKGKILEEEKQKLNELNDQVWSLEDLYCNQIWQFSREHDFSVIFKHYPFVTKSNRCKKQKNNSKDDAERCSKLVDLISEIDAIKAEIFDLNRGKNFKRDVEGALMNLKKLQLISEEAIELLRLINPPEPSYDAAATISMPIYDEMIPNDSDKITRHKNDLDCKNFKNKKARGNQKELLLRNKLRSKGDKLNIADNKKVIATSKNYSQLYLERSIVFSAKAGVTNVSTELTNDGKHKSFTPKERSDISIIFEKHREHTRHK